MPYAAAPSGGTARRNSFVSSRASRSWAMAPMKSLPCCAAVALERPALTNLKTTAGDALYVALEDNRRRLQNRINKLLPFGTAWPARLTLATRWQRLDAGGVDDVSAWCDSVPEPR